MRRPESHDRLCRWFALPLAVAIPYTEGGNPAREEARARSEGVVDADFVPEVHVVISIKSGHEAVENWAQEARPLPGLLPEGFEFVDARPEIDPVVTFALKRNSGNSTFGHFIFKVST